jgi:hypothetical protein
MPARVKMSDLVDGLEAQGDETHAFLDRQTGEVLLLMDEDLGADDEEEEGDLSDCGEWERESIEQAKAVQADEGGRFLALPDRFDVNEWEMMRDFAMALEDDSQAESLQNAIHGRGAFRYFKDRVHEFGLADAWYKFREEQYRQVALDWCEANGVDVDTDA